MLSDKANKAVVAVLGAGGTMGAGMARNLAVAGFEVRAWNRSAQRIEQLAQLPRVSAFQSAAEAADRATALITILSDLNATRETIEAVGSTASGALWLQMGTVGIEGTEELREFAERNGLLMIDAPVLGTKGPAQKGQLVILASGPEDLRPAAQAYFDALGKRTIWVGSEPGPSSRLKVAINAWIVTAVEGTAETLALAEGIGIDPELVLDALAGGPLDLPYMRIKGEAMLSADFSPSFRLGLAAKDAGLAVEAAEAAGLRLPMLAAIRERLSAAAEEHGEKDLAATYLLSARGG